MPAGCTERSEDRALLEKRAPVGRAWGGLLLVAIAVALYLPNIDDYFLADDFDLIQSFHDKPPIYFLQLLYSNESGDIWADWGIDADQGRGFLRPLKIWLLKLQLTVWGPRALGFHLTATLFFVGLVLAVRRILTRFLPDRPEMAWLGAGMVAIHPLFSEVVPFITASEELIAMFFGLLAFDALLAYRTQGRSTLPFYGFFVLSLLTKESGITVLGLALGYDLVGGRILTRSRAKLARTVRLYAPFAGILAIYFFLRFLAFGNFKGGDAIVTGYLAPSVFVRFHRLFFEALVDPTMLSIGGYTWAATGVTLAALAGLVSLVLCGKRISPERRRDLLFLGPVWYVLSTAVLFGSHFALRRNGLPLIGMAAFFSVGLAAVLGRASARVRIAAAVGTLLAVAALWVPPAVRNSREFDRASRAVREAREEIEERTAELSPICAVRLANVPQSVVAPYYFGWGLVSALKRPFTESDLARRCTVYEPRHRLLNRIRVPPPTEFDRVIEFDPGRWRTREDHERELGRLRRIGLLRKGSG